ncbi:MULTISPECIES: ABC transporter ATP-binding protein [Arthrobacter]|uniref:ABC transporter ATP-binding protein n=2 Tax=Arthrobacter TaxID=1663 RepID=A0ABU9KKA9_9MICC|nr:ABC transporter ATP-binding protein [Arthrobacter sp. YJM1]MDP5227060.1 ABC transporter ATP-binding protein [Arthrobacter sp. YJM1]
MSDTMESFEGPLLDQPYTEGDEARLSAPEAAGPTPAPGNRLPIAGSLAVRAEAWRLVKRNRQSLAWVMVFYAAAAVTGLVGPYIIGRLVDTVSGGTTMSAVTGLSLVLLGAVVAQAFLQRFASYRSMVLGEKVFADLREEFMGDVTSLPLSTVERAGTGDLLSRTTNDVEALSHAVRFGVPRLLVALVTLALTLAAAFVVSPLLGLGLLVSAPFIAPVTRWYLKRSGPAYQREHAAYGTIDGTISEAADGALTVDALSLGPQRIGRTRAAIREAFEAERYTLWLRSMLFPVTELALWLPAVVVVLWGGWLVSVHSASAGEVAAVALYSVSLTEPVNTLILWLDELQFGAASLARIVGVKEVPADRTVSGESPRGSRISVRNVTFAYRAGRNVLHGVDLELVPGERLAMVGPSGAGKSTLGRLIAGINPPSAGSVTVGGVPLVDLAVEELRREVALVTQEHHVFVGTLADNLRLGKEDAGDQELLEALRDVGAEPWFQALPDGLETELGSGGHALTPAQAQELALARLVLADPHTLVLDEATSLIDPQAARSVEQSLGAVLSGRTVVAIAHRLHTAHDADRVAVVEDGRITELGSHDELLALNGSYAALWRSWRSE